MSKKNALVNKMFQNQMAYNLLSIAVKSNDIKAANDIQEQFDLALCWCDELEISANDLGVECKHGNCDKCLEKIINNRRK